MDCIFCKIAINEIPSDKIYEDEEVVAFLDIQPVNRGHAVVIPKKHSTDILNTEDEIVAATLLKAKKIAAGIMKAVNADGFNLTNNTGLAAGQSVFHLHFHIIPRFATDGLKAWPHKESEPKSRFELAQHIKKFIG